MTDAVAHLCSAVSGSVADVSVGALAVALTLHVGKLLAEARSWHWILRHAHDRSDLGFKTTAGAFVGSIGANAVLPARVGEALRVGVVRKRVAGSSVITVAATIVLETAIEVVFGLAVIVAVLVAGRQLSSASTSPSGIPTGALMIATGATLGVLACLTCRFRGRLRPMVGRMARGLSVVASPRSFVTGVLSWKLVAWALRLGAVDAFLVAFHIPAAPWTAVVVVAAQNAAGAVPLLPGNAGTQQAAIAVALAGTASATNLLGFGVGMQASTAITDIVLGAVALTLVAGRDDLRSALRILRPGRHADPGPAISTTAS
jgi:uncharacterized membrane protein YbhN (UPF0104 family)